MNFRGDNIDYRDLLKLRQDKQKKLSTNKNPFIITLPQTEQNVYKGLYKFDAENELEDYALPQDTKEIDVKKVKGGRDTTTKSHHSSVHGKSKIKSEIEQQDQFNQEDYYPEDQEGEKVAVDEDINYTKLVTTLFEEKKENKEKNNRIQNAQFVDSTVAATLQTIQTGEDAISFFAKYGNTTPIKFINCVKALNIQRPQFFRPYDLKVILTSENQKELTLHEYYTISASGIVHVWTEKGKREGGNQGDTSTEVISLSDWMHESTLFNIITNIQFFKNYAITKIFNIWKANVRYRIFHKTREELVKDAFIAKPAFASHLMEKNKMLYDMGMVKTISEKITQSKSWETDEFFNVDQKRERDVAKKSYSTFVEQIITQVEVVCKEVVERTKIKDQTDVEEARFGQQIKQKPMNLIRKEALERQYLLNRAKKDKDKLRNFTRLIDYQVVETLVHTSLTSMKFLLEQMKIERAKAGLFNTTVMFDTNGGVSYTPDEGEISKCLMKMLEEMIATVKDVPRVIENQNFENYIKLLSKEGILKVNDTITESVLFAEINNQIQEKIKNDFIQAQKHVKERYQKCRPIFESNLNGVKIEWLKEDRPLDEIKSKIQEYRRWMDELNMYITDKAKGILNVDGKKIKGKLQPYVSQNLDKIKEDLYLLMKRKSQNVYDTLDHYVVDLDKLNKNCGSLKDYADYIILFNQIMEALKDNKLEKRKIQIEDMQTELKKSFDVSPLTNTDQTQLDKIITNYITLQSSYAQAKLNIESKKPEMSQNLEKEVDDLKKKIVETTSKVNAGKLIMYDTDTQEALDRLEDMKSKHIDRYKKRDETLNEWSRLMTIQPQPNQEMKELEDKFNDRRLLWTHVDRFAQLQKEWYETNITNLDSEVIEKEMRTFDQGIMQLRVRSYNLTKEGQDQVLQSHAKFIAEDNKNIPVILALGNRNLKTRHWKRIMEILGNPNWQPGSQMSLDGLINLGASDSEKLEKLEDISGRASGEAGIEAQMEEIRKKWLELNFEVKPYRTKDQFILGSVEDIMAALDDHQLKVQTMMGTRFVADIRGEVEVWEKKLLLISEILDEWLSCMRQWMYLQNIFSAEDIQKQLPAETTKFMQVDQFWKDIMSKTNKRPLVQDACANEDLLKQFLMYNKILEDIQKCLENYLETKRSAFARFYFLSNDELLEILSQTRNPHAVQGHLRKCFDNISRIKFTEVEDSKEIVAMQSAEPETMPEVVPFSQSVFAEGNVEHWLFRIQEMMILTLFDSTKKAFLQYPENGLDRKDWLFNYPAQPVLTVDLIKWTEGCTNAIEGASLGRESAVPEYYDFMKEMINQMVAIVREPLDTQQRTLMGALIVLDVHARDVVRDLVSSKVENINDFQWSKQLRYYWDAEIDNCLVRQTNTRFVYSYEYLGNGPRLVITPLTDKCYMTLTGAKHLSYGGAPAGPAGTGKTETTKDLAKALAIQCVVFNCSDGLDFKTMGRFFSGLAQCGAWACFDEFNRIDIEVLSVIAQQILTIQQAIRERKEIFEFEGRDIPLNGRFGVFITMNPGYAGRTELPDNLKALFRPVAMMIPDYRLIAEIILFSEGFETASILARQMVKLYSLSSEQLSKQDHYDFGMRAVKSVLVMAGALRRKDSTVTEDIVLIRAMRDSNVPKFLIKDLPLFMNIIKDLFPGVETPYIDYGNLQKEIEHQLEVKNYIKTKGLITKIIQLMETIMVRHGVMVVGITGTAKTTNISTLAAALTQLQKDGSTDYYHKNVKQEKLNPKSVTMEELFGYTNVMTNEWTDGIAAALIRDNVQDCTSNDPNSKRWIIFDGPVDALWIENMNTVLDDNKMLCLNNGQRIKLPATFTMMFEVQDLAVASPATVSRCGMVYMEPEHLGWEPLIDTWAIQFRQKYKDKEEQIPLYVNNLIDKTKSFFKDNLDFIRRTCVEVISTVDVNLVRACINLVNIMFQEAKDQINLDREKPADADNICVMVLLFSFIWSAGGNINDNPRHQSRVKFSSHIKGKILKIFNGFPIEGEVYDYYPDFVTREFKPWTLLVETYVYDREVPYFNILVPTADTVKFGSVMGRLINNNNNLLMSGETGVGKSVIIQDYIMKLIKTQADRFVYSTLNFSAQTKSKNLQDLFLDKDKFQRKKKDLLGPPSGKKMIVFIDDVNMPALEKFGAQPPNELFRQIIDQGGFYELKKFFFIHIQDCVFITCCATPGGGRNPVSPRLFRHFNMLWVPDLSQRSMESIFTSILEGFLSESPHKGAMNPRVAHPIVKATVEMYLRITKELLPTPTKSHYTYNLRDISKIFQGVLMINYDHVQKKEDLYSLWTHECTRVFHDRLVNADDRQFFFNLMIDPINNTLDMSEWTKETLKQFLYGDFANQNREYMQITSEQMESLPNRLMDFLMQYNASNAKQMNLVFFKDAIVHLGRICRVLRQPRGNSLLIGVGGSGRQSLTRMASSIQGYTTFSIEIAKNYQDPQWKEDLQQLLKTAGAKNTPVVFLFSDTQIVKESFLEDINNVLNTGEVPNLWAVEDLEEIMGDLRPLAKERKLFDSRDVLLKFFIQLVRENLHIVLAFSPVGAKLRMRCRQFPSIINCCAIDWFEKWPEDALYSVAEKEYRKEERLGIGEFVEKLARMSMRIHQDVETKSEEFYDIFQRKNYVTPTSYLEIIKLYIDMMKEQQNILPLKIKQYTVGLQTLQETNETVQVLREKIIEFQPILEKSAKENAEKVIVIEAEKKVAAETREVCSKETAEAQIIRDEVKQIKDVCEQEVALAMPILQQAQDAVKKLDKNSINEMKSFPKPPALVALTMSAVCLLFGEKENDWDTSKQLLSNMKFLESLVDFDVNTVKQRTWDKLQATYLVNPQFNQDDVGQVSVAAMAIVVWVIASDQFFQVWKEVEPKKKRLAEAEVKLKAVEAEVAKKVGALKEVEDNLATLERDFESSLRRAESLQMQQEVAQAQLERGEKLEGGLSGEAIRWKQSQRILEADLKNLTGNMMIAAASVAYTGPFIYSYRQDLIKSWIEECKKNEIPVSDDFSLSRILTEEVEIREWQEHGLPSDSLSIENGIFIKNCRRWPLIIDPQGQANKWIRAAGLEINLQITQLSQPNFLKILENSIRFGNPVLLENIEEDLDPALEPILLKQTVQKQGQIILRLGDQDVPYHRDFKFYMTTKMPNPHYIPEISIQTTIINFTVTPAGLEDQLLVEVVRQERIQLEEKRISLILQISQDKRQLQDLEDRILKQIGEAAGRILDDDELIKTLQASKITSDAVNQRIEQAKLTSIEIDQARESYRPIAKRGSVLYFVIADLALIDPMYQYSLDFFIKIFKMRLDKAKNPPDPNERILVLIEDITLNFYLNICRGLFEKDKLLFSFMIAVQIQISSGEINSREWNFFLRGPTGDVVIPQGDVMPDFLLEKVYQNIYGLCSLSSIFKDLVTMMKDPAHEEKFKEIALSNDPQSLLLPEVLQSALSPFQKLLLMKEFRNQKFILLAQNFVRDALGKTFTVSPLFDLQGSFTDSTCTTPIIFVLSPGADPVSYLISLAKEKGFFQSKLKMLSLGQGQGDIAQELIQTGRRNGEWVCLQNCHLAISWMNTLERIQEQQVESETDPNYRLWLTSMPSTQFPVAVLQSGIQLTNEPPKGLQANVKRTYNEIQEKEYQSCTQVNEYQQLLFSLAFFHAVILERRKFGSIGWNIPYEWMNSDFETCQLQLKMYLDEQPDVPWTTLNYIIAEINYGGRVTDDKDVRLITALLLKYFTPEVLKGSFNFDKEGVYYSPQELDLSLVKAYIDSFPDNDNPQVFGLHANAIITFEQKTAKEFFDTLLITQPKSTGAAGGGKAAEFQKDPVEVLCEEILKELPKTLNDRVVEDPNSLDVFRAQEVLQFNRLLIQMKATLVEMQQAIQGLVVMSQELENMYSSFLFQRVPENWENIAYPSLKPLGSWTQDLILRIEFFSAWIEKGVMDSYWISAMFFPQGFMTSALQTYARKTQIAIDTLVFRTEVQPFKGDEIKKVPTDGVNIHGLFIQGCRWDMKNQRLEDSHPQVLFEEIPVIWLEPVQSDEYKPESVFKCPLYKTSTRRGTLSTTGHSTNFVMYMDLLSAVTPDHWVRRGVALLCQLDD